MALKPGNGEAGERDPRLDHLYRDAAREMPPARLDAAILAAARREVGARPRPLSALRRWRVPVSIAAVVVLSVSLVTLVREEGGDNLLREERIPAAPPPPRVAESAPQPAQAAKAPEAGEPLAAPPDARRRAVRAPQELTLRRDEAAAPADADEVRPREGESARSGIDAAAPAGPAPAASSPQAPLAGALSYQLQGTPPRAEADAARESTAAMGTRGSSGETEQAPAVPKPLADRPHRDYARAAPKPLADKTPVEERLAPTMAKLKPAPPAWQGLEREPPQKWLERLAELRKQGRTQQADELLAEFKRRFPDHPLPAGTE